MRSVFLVWMLIFAYVEVEAREVKNINKDWSFFTNQVVSADGAISVSIPHMWNNDALSGDRSYFRGIGHYLKRIEIPQIWIEKRIFLRFKRANIITNVMVNGKHVGEHRGGNSMFTFEITKDVKFGEINIIWVTVNNAPQMDVLPTAGDQNFYGGIYDDVEMIATDQILVSVTDDSSQGVYIKTNAVSDGQVSGSAEIEIDTKIDAPIEVKLKIIDADKKVVVVASQKLKVFAGSREMVSIPFQIANPKLWRGVSDPYLYDVQVEVVRGEQIIDNIALKTGFRYYEVDPKLGFKLNGVPYKLNGVVVHNDRSMVGAAISKYHVQGDFELIKEIGANAVRVSGRSHHPEFYDMCDKKGIVVWDDMPLIGATYLVDKAFVNTSAFKKNGLDQVREIVKQKFNHPSIIFWGVFSDLAIRGDDPTNYVKQINDLIKNEDENRLTAVTSRVDGDINFITDVVVWNQKLGWHEGIPEDVELWLNQLEKKWSHTRSGISYSAGASIHNQEDILQKPNPLGAWHPERWQTHLHEVYWQNIKDKQYLFATFIGNMFDYGAAGRNWGSGQAINDKGLVTFDRTVRKDAFYLYKANWNRDDPFVYIAEKRWSPRGGQSQSIKVYSNCKEVELIVNGKSQGKQKSDTGIFNWGLIFLEKGENQIVAKAYSAEDKASIVIE